ncbi:MFS transporter [Nocardia sp. MH4]|uniref:MFS transporter n=1 Tax=Nocardia TaxID=1817 RepID=UPI001C4F030B|nr:MULTISPECIES: MFS transporter [Nocardia]MBW0274024.1 MFS transporter [Nocardia sp. MH4]
MSEHPAQRRTLAVLVAAQIFSGAGLAAGITVGALLAQDMLGSTGLAGLPSAMFTVGSAAAAVGVGRISQRAGRRAGLTVGYLVGALGSFGVVAAAVTGSLGLLFASLIVYGAGTATSLQARYAGADLATPAHRARAISTVLVATTVGAVVGPNLLHPMASLATAWGIPPLSGPFVLSGAAYLLAGLVLWVLLRPDPLVLARELVRTDEPTAAAELAAGKTWSAPIVAGATVMVVTQLVMAAVMTMTPIHMQHHGHGVGAAGVVIAVHVAGMYLPSLLSGLLVDRIGAGLVAVAAAGTLVAAGLAAALAPPSSVLALAAALGLLGLGWNLGLVAGTTMIADATPVATRARTQGTVDVGIAVAGAGGGLGSGLIVAAADYPGLALLGAAIALLIVPALAWSSRRPRADAQAPALDARVDG